MENTSDNDWLKEIESRLAASTPGPWSYINDDSSAWVIKKNIEMDETIGSFDLTDDARFIAHSREDIEKLTKALRVAEVAIKRAENSFDNFSTKHFWVVQVEAKYPAYKPMERRRDEMREALAAIEKMGDGE